jgi:hypothetical protein
LHCKFGEDLWLPFEDSIGCVNLALRNGMIDKTLLVKEFSNAIAKEDFDWIQLAKESTLLLNPVHYSNFEISNYVKYLLWDYLDPTQIWTAAQIAALRYEAISILQKYESNNGWMFSYHLREQLKMRQPFQQLEYYHLWKLPCRILKIELKSIEEKEREIGYLRYRQ